MTSIIIDNCVVTSSSNQCVCIRSVDMYAKMYPHIKLELLPKISFGSKQKDNYVISLLCAGKLKFDNIRDFKL